MRVSATIVRAGLPPANTAAIGYQDWICAVTDVGDGPIAVWSIDRLDKDRWLLPGARVNLDIDPGKISRISCFRLDWSSVPTVEELVARGDPVVTDPRGARTAAKEANAAATEILPTAQTLMGRGPTSHMPQTGPGLNVETWSAGFDQALAVAADKPAPEGRVRAVAVLVAIRQILHSTKRSLITGAPDPEDLNMRQHRYRKPMRGSEAIFSVTVPGKAPWAVFDKHFRSPDDRPLYRTPALFPWLPVTVPANAQEPIEVVWDEVQPLAASSMGLRSQVDMFRNAWALKAAAHQQRMPGVGMPPPGAALPPNVVIMPSAQGNAPAVDYSMLPPVAHQAAQAFAASLRSMPPQAIPNAIQQAMFSLNSVAPELRPAYVALWRAYGIPV
jgi:hypothetical protein